MKESVAMARCACGRSVAMAVLLNIALGISLPEAQEMAVPGATLSREERVAALKGFIEATFEDIGGKVIPAVEQARAKGATTFQVDRLRARAFINLPEADRYWLLAEGDTFLAEDPVDWEIVDKIMHGVGANEPHPDIVVLAQRVLRKPLDTANRNQKWAIETALFLLAKQSTEESLDTLVACMVLPAKRLDESLFPLSEGESLPQEYALYIMETTARQMTSYAADDMILPTIQKAVSYYSPPLPWGLAHYLDFAEKMASGDPNPSGDGGPNPIKPVTPVQGGSTNAPEVPEAQRALYSTALSNDGMEGAERAARLNEKLAACEELMRATETPDSLRRWAEFRRFDLLRAAERHEEMFYAIEDWVARNPEAPEALERTKQLAMLLATSFEQHLPMPWEARLEKLHSLMGTALSNSALGERDRISLRKDYAEKIVLMAGFIELEQQAALNARAPEGEARAEGLRELHAYKAQCLQQALDQYAAARDELAGYATQPGAQGADGLTADKELVRLERQKQSTQGTLEEALRRAD